MRNSWVVLLMAVLLLSSCAQGDPMPEPVPEPVPAPSPMPAPSPKPQLQPTPTPARAPKPSPTPMLSPTPTPEVDTGETTVEIVEGEKGAGNEEDMIFKQETAPIPSWIKDDPMKETEGPWYESLYIAVSQDGLNFTNEKMFLEHSGVANLILTSDHKLIAIFQYFSYVNEDMFDVMAYAVSDDYGNTWSSVKPVRIAGLNEGPKPCDPTLVELDDKTLRLYFTYHKPGNKYPQLFSAYGDSIESEFISEGQQLDTDEIILDPAVVKFNGIWHHYTVNHGAQPSGTPNNSVNIHSISETGLNFELVDDIKLDMGMLGDVIEDENGLRFYSGSKSAFSTDGYNWTVDSGERVKGADPGTAKLPDGSYIMIYPTVTKVH